MKIRSIETFTHGQSLCVVRVRTDDGAEGFGQVAPYNADITATVLHRQIAPHVLGANPLAVDAISDRCIEANHKFPWSYVCRALAGVDTALWDLRGRLERKRVCDLISDRGRDKVAVYGSSMRRDIKPRDEADRLLRLRDSQGFSAFKIRVGKTCGHNADEWPGRTEELIPVVRDALGGDVKLLVDGNSCYTPDRAIDVGHFLEQYNVCHFEEPCPYWELEWTAKVAAALEKIDIAGGEQDNDLAQFRRMIAMRAVDVVQPDVCYVGGLTRALRVAKMAADANLACVPHSANLSLITVFTIHMLAAIPNAGPYLEYSIEPDAWIGDQYRPKLHVREGHVEVPGGFGWGVEINPEWLAGANRAVSER